MPDTTNNSPIITSQKTVKEFKAPEWLRSSERKKTSFRLRSGSEYESNFEGTGVEIRRNDFGSRSLRIPKEGLQINGSSMERNGSNSNIHIKKGLGNISTSRSYSVSDQSRFPKATYSAEPFNSTSGKVYVTDSRYKPSVINSRVVPIAIERPDNGYCYQYDQGPVQYIAQPYPPIQYVIQEPPVATIPMVAPQFISMPRSQSATNVQQYENSDGSRVIETHEIVPNHDGTEEIEIRKRTTTRTRPIRTVSQTNILSQPARISNNWTSESNIRGNIGKTGYSAHRENAQNVALNEFQNRESYSARNHLDGKYYEELEVITLQPIGKGVQDLHSGSYISTLPRSVGFRSGQQSPSISNFNRQKFTYESSTNDIRTKTGTGKSYLSPQVAASQVSQQNASYVSSGHMNGQTSDGQEYGVRAALDSQNIWYQPEISREQVIEILQNEDAGSFIIRKSTTFPNSYGLALKVPKMNNRMIDQNDDRSIELVRHFLIEGVDGGVHLRGFSNEAVFKTLSHFVHHHTQQKDALPCCLKLPNTPVSAINTMVTHGAAHSNFAIGRSGSVGSRDFNTYMRANSQIEQLDRNRGIKFDLVYLGNVMVDRLCEEAGIRKATTEILAQHERGSLLKKTIVNVEVIPNDGIYIHDAGRGNVKKFIKASDFEWIGYDPELRTFSDRSLTNLSESRILGIVSQKNKIILHENSAVVFCEVNPSKTDYIINYIKMNFMRR